LGNQAGFAETKPLEEFQQTKNGRKKSPWHFLLAGHGGGIGFVARGSEHSFSKSHSANRFFVEQREKGPVNGLNSDPETRRKRLNV